MTDRRVNQEQPERYLAIDGEDRRTFPAARRVDRRGYRLDNLDYPTQMLTDGIDGGMLVCEFEYCVPTVIQQNICAAANAALRRPKVTEALDADEAGLGPFGGWDGIERRKQDVSFGSIGGESRYKRTNGVYFNERRSRSFDKGALIDVEKLQREIFRAFVAAEDIDIKCKREVAAIASRVAKAFMEGR